MAIALAALVVAIGGVAFATIPDSQGTIHGCYQKGSGSLRVVESAGDCRTSESAIQWNQEGPPGPPGSSGGQAVAFDEEPGEVTTQSNTPVDLGGPSVTVTVPASGLIAVFARVAEESPQGEAQVVLFESTDFNPGLPILGACCTNGQRQWTTIQNPAGTRIPHEASWLLREATPGSHTYSLRYREVDPGGTAHFRERKLWIAPLG
jgi:hypothetical protein